MYIIETFYTYICKEIFSLALALSLWLCTSTSEALAALHLDLCTSSSIALANEGYFLLFPSQFT